MVESYRRRLGTGALSSSLSSLSGSTLGVLGQTHPIPIGRQRFLIKVHSIMQYLTVAVKYR